VNLTTGRGDGCWRLLADDGADAADGLALDEALMARYARGEPDCPATLRLYSYRSHCALVGRYQNLEAEVDLAACQRTGTPVSRRPTGGGAIIMGSGQLGVAFADRAPAGRRPREIIEDMSAGLVAGLARLGVHASFRGKNDLEVDGRKIAGLGLYIDDAGAMLFHASVLGDLDVGFMLRVLRVPAAKLDGQAAAAVAGRVTTVTREAGRPYHAAGLRPVIAAGFSVAFGVALERAQPSEPERALAAKLAAGRYRAPDWLAERSAGLDGAGSAVLKTPAGLARVYLTNHGDLIKNVIIVGDFNELPPAVPRLESALRWHRLAAPAVAAAVTGSGADGALGVAAERLVTAILEAGRQAGQRATAAPVRSAGSCYFPEAEGGRPAALGARSRDEEA
jgi:lipoate-protein ligase A